MPATTGADLVTVRSHPQRLTRHLSFVPETVVFSCQVNGIPDIDNKTGGIYAFTYDNAAGTYGDVLPEMRVYAGSSAGGKDIGALHVRLPATATKIYVSEVSPGRAALEDGVYITVVYHFPPRHRMPRLVTAKSGANFVNKLTIYHDYSITYSDENEDIIPKANIVENVLSDGVTLARPAGFVDSGEVYRDMPLSGLASVASGTATITGYLWDIGDGSYAVGTSTSSEITARFPASTTFRYISLTVTDSNSKSHTMYFPVWVHNSTNLPISNFTVGSDKRTKWRDMSFEFYGDDNDFDESIIPEGSLCCYWEADAKFGTATEPTNYVHSFLGWVTADSEQIRLGGRGKYVLSVAGMGYWLSKFRGFTEILTDKSVATRWNHINGLTINQAGYYILREFTNALDLVNFFPPYEDNPTQEEPIGKGTILSQLEAIYSANEIAQVRCDSHGNIFVRRLYSMLDTTDRLDFPTTIGLTSEDWHDADGLNISEEKLAPVSIVLGPGSRYDGNTVVHMESIAPGFVPNHSSTDDEMPYQRLPVTGTRTKLNQLTGNYWAYKDKRKKNRSIKLVGNMDIFEPAWGEPVSLTWDAGSLRGTALATELYLVNSVTVAHSNDTGKLPKEITLGLEEVTEGDPGVYNPLPPPAPPPTASGGLPPIAFQPWIFPATTTFTADTGAGTQWMPNPGPALMILISGEAGGSILITEDANTLASEGGPTWTRYQMALDGDPIQFLPDPFSPYYTDGLGYINGLIVTTSKIYRITDILSAQTTTEVFAFAEISNRRSLGLSLGSEYQAVVTSMYEDGTYITFSDDLDTWAAEEKYGPIGVTFCYDDNPPENTDIAADVSVAWSTATSSYSAEDSTISVSMVVSITDSASLSKPIVVNVTLTGSSSSSEYVVFPEGSVNGATVNLTVGISSSPITLTITQASYGVDIGAIDIHSATLTGEYIRYFDFTQSSGSAPHTTYGQHDWYVPAYNAGRGVFTPLSGWVFADESTGDYTNARGINLALDGVIGNVASVELIYDAVFGSEEGGGDNFASINYGGDSRSWVLANVPFMTDASIQRDAVRELDEEGFSFHVNCSRRLDTSPPHSGSGVLKMVIVRGSGSVPSAFI